MASRRLRIPNDARSPSPAPHEEEGRRRGNMKGEEESDTTAITEQHLPPTTTYREESKSTASRYAYTCAPAPAPCSIRTTCRQHSTHASIARATATASEGKRTRRKARLARNNIA